MIRCLPVGEVSTNCYIVSGDEDERSVLVVDPGGDGDVILRALEGCRVRAVLLTHGHFDHTGALDCFPGCPVYIGARDAAMLTDPDLNAGFLCGDRRVRPPATDLLQGGEELRFEGFSRPAKVIASPGHTPGGMCYLLGNDLLTGDTLFRYGFGRTDLPGGDHRALVLSLKALFSLEGDLKVYPGHGDMTTLDRERALYGALPPEQEA